MEEEGNVGESTGYHESPSEGDRSRDPTEHGGNLSKWKGMNESVTASPQPDNEDTTNIAMTEIKVTDNMSPPASAKNKCSTTSEDTKLKYIKFCEVLILTSVMVIVIGLSLIPTVFFLLPSQNQPSSLTNSTSSDCLNNSTYSGDICREALTSLQICFSGVTSSPPALSIPSLVDQETGEGNALTLVNGLSLLSPSPQCREAITPFLCLSIFTLCDSGNNLHTILREDCLELREDICAEEWSQAAGHLGEGVLPDCESLPDITEECIGNVENSSRIPTTNVSDTEQATTIAPGNETSLDGQLVCSEGFYFDENGTNLCRPTCGEFFPASLSAQIIQRTALAISFITSVLMFILALTVQREVLLTFPSILFVYMCISTFIGSGTLIAGFFDNAALFCRSIDVISNFDKGKETPFCNITGFVFTYIVEQIYVLALLHAFFLNWAVRFPLSYRQLRMSVRIRYAHVISVVLAVALPLIGPSILLSEGFITAASPTLACVGRDLDTNYYAIILPVSILVGMTSYLLVFLFWTIFKEFVLLTRSEVGKIGKSELKISIITIYYTVVGIMGLVSYTILSASDIHRDGIIDYIVCESRGPSDCTLQNFGVINEMATTAAIAMIFFIPVVAILFNCKPEACKCTKKSNYTGTGYTDLTRSQQVKSVN